MKAIRLAAGFLTGITAVAALGADPTTRPVRSPHTGPATTQIVTQPTAPQLEAHEWGVFVLDASTKSINPDGVITSTLPSFVSDHRFGAAAYAPAPVVNQVMHHRFMVINGMIVQVQTNSDSTGSHDAATPLDDPSEPTPVCLIRLVGSCDSKVDVTVNIDSGNFAGEWPKARERTNQILWQDLSLNATADGLSLATVPANSWFSTLRQTPAATLAYSPHEAEDFLLYDPQFSRSSALAIKSYPDLSLDVTNIGTFPIDSVVFYQRDHDRLLSGRATALAVAAAAPVTTAAPTTTPSTTQPATQKTTGQIKLTAVPSTQPADVMSVWDQELHHRGLDDRDCALISRMIAKYALDGNRLTAVYLMNQAAYDKMLPLDITPQPAKITRVGIVIVRNADPNAKTEVDELIATLGDPDWARRDAAYNALRAMGPAAVPKLTGAKSNSDLEIAWRAERLLSMLAKPAGQ